MSRYRVAGYSGLHSTLAARSAMSGGELWAWEKQRNWQRLYSTKLPSKPSSLWRNLRAYQIYGANTNVGKTVMSTILCKTLARSQPTPKIWYLKPISTGPLEEADDRHISRFSPEANTRCLFQFDEAVSPHIAARSKPPLPDSEVLDGVLKYLTECSQFKSGVALVETAGGVHSPTPSGSSQADLYRPLRLPIWLVADHRLGGISATISAFESLHVRGYDVDAVLQFRDDYYQNHEYLKTYFEKKGISTVSIPLPPKREANEDEDVEIMSDYYEKMSKNEEVREMIAQSAERHRTRIQSLEQMASKACKQIWYPFTQHKNISEKTLLTIDSASGDFFQTTTPIISNDQENNGLLSPTFDGSASWWTQGLGHGNPDLSLSAAYAAGRYGHVMFASAIHEPALNLASSLLKNLGNPRLGKVFYSDNGSTGMEVATKMALTAAYERYKWNVPKSEVGIIGLKGSYHGDTVGAMDCSEPSTYNERVHWYQGRGYWFDFPQVKMVKGKWIVEPPAEVGGVFGTRNEFGSLGDIFDIKTRYDSATGQRYRRHIEETLHRLVRVEGRTFGGVIMEPVILGAGGMLFADPLFQHCLVQVVRENSQIFGSPSTSSTDPCAWTGLPIIFDEVFTGIYRLGRFSASSFLQIHPDISCHAKLLTGGLVPLCATVASDSIYYAFLGTDKRDALLHGHSYTAHAVGCQVANTSLNMMMDMDRGGKWQVYKNDWTEPTSTSPTQMLDTNSLDVWSVWTKEFVQQISNRRDVESVVALGSVLGITLHDSERGYNSSAAAGLQKKVLEGSTNFKVHSRVLGNVFYLMASQVSERKSLQSIERLLLDSCLK